MMNWNSPLPKSLVDLLLGWPTNHKYGIYGKLWNICPSILTWEVWKERNRKIFKNQEMHAANIIKKVEACIVETLNSYIIKSQF